MSEHMRRLEGNTQPLQRIGNQLMIKMVERGIRKINVEHKWCKMKKCLTQIQSNKLVSIKLSFSMFIQDMLTVWTLIFNIFLYRLLDGTYNILLINGSFSVADCGLIEANWLFHELMCPNIPLYRINFFLRNILVSEKRYTNKEMMLEWKKQAGQMGKMQMTQQIPSLAR